MELLEYQAKKLFRMVDIPVLPSQTITDSRKIKQLQIPYPVVLKSQVRSGGRGKAGGVRFVANTIDAIAAARSIFNLSILGEYPEVILAEAHYDTEREIFLAIVLDYERQCPVLLGSAFGGMNVDALLANLQQVPVKGEFSLFYARRLVASMGLTGGLICSVSEIVAKMYRLFQSTDLDLIEINPLAIDDRGNLMALDGKITINNCALARQPIVETLNFSQRQKQTVESSLWQVDKDFSSISWRWLDWHHQAGSVATICNSFDSALLTWDLLAQSKIIPAYSALIESSLVSEADNLQLYRQQLWEIFQELESRKGINAVLINIWETEAVEREIVQAVLEYTGVRYPTEAASSMTSANNTKQIASEGDIKTQTLLKSDRVKADRSSAPSPGKETAIERPYFLLRLLNPPQIEDLPLDCLYISNNLEKVVARTNRIV